MDFIRFYSVFSLFSTLTLYPSLARFDQEFFGRMLFPICTQRWWCDTDVLATRNQIDMININEGRKQEKRNGNSSSTGNN